MEKLSTCLHSGLIGASDVGEFGLATQLGPDLVERLGGRDDEVDATIAGLGARDAAPHRVAFRFRVPDLLDLEQAAVTSTHVVLAELQRGSPPCPFQFPTIGLLQHGAVSALP